LFSSWFSWKTMVVLSLNFESCTSILTSPAKCSLVPLDNENPIQLL
jgi:hypothetical protein